MTTEEKEKIIQLRKAGICMAQIGEELGISKNIVKSFCRRQGLAGDIGTESVAVTKPCLFCGLPVIQTPGRKEKKFCSDACRHKWWNEHANEANRGAMKEYICPHCGNAFYAYPARRRKYCSHECYIRERFGGAPCE